MVAVSFPSHLTPFERQRLEGLLARLTTQPQLSRVVAFGSRARGRSRGDSDLDLAVYFSAPRSRELEHWLDAQAAASEVDHDAPRLHLVAFFADEPPSRLDGALRREGIVLWTKN